MVGDGTADDAAAYDDHIVAGVAHRLAFAESLSKNKFAH
jgi:hypothetical protein